MGVHPLRSPVRRSLCRGMFALLTGLFATACQADNVTCASVPELGIQLHVQDAATTASLDAVVTVTVSRLTAPFDSITGDPRTAVIVTSDRPGRYHVRVTAPGYVQSERDVDAPATTRQCASVEPQFVTIKLVHQ